ncbi:MAG: PDGLE domain-containing protein [Candidatus Micrarchaeota archaeon]
MNKHTMRNLYIGMAILILLTPLGLLASGTAFGEWGSEELKKELGYAPVGVEHGEGLWGALLPDYSVPGLEGDFLQSSVGYVASAALGCALTGACILALGKFLAKKEAENALA